MGKYIDITGETHNMLTAIEQAGINKYGVILWKFRCDCGNETKTTVSHFRKGHKKSCGCLKIKKATTHGMTKTRLYTIWRSMNKRCNNSNTKAYPRYGGRGITVCNEWLNSFEAFRDWALSHGYSDNLTIDRENNNGNYEPSNCRWATMEKQARNRGNNNIVDFCGSSMTLTEASALSGINRRTLSDRVARGLTGDTLFRHADKGARNCERD